MITASPEMCETHMRGDLPAVVLHTFPDELDQSQVVGLYNPESVIFRRTAPIHAVRFRADWLGWVIDSVTDQNTKEVTHTVVSDEMCRTDPIYRTKVKEYCIRTHQETAETEDSEPTVSGENKEPL